MVNLFNLYKYDIKNIYLKNIIDFFEEINNLNKEALNMGFFDIYTSLTKDYLYILNNIDNLKHSDSNSKAYHILDGIEELHAKYNLTKICKFCQPLGVTKQEIYPILFTFDNNDINIADSLEKLILNKFDFKNTRCPNCNYTKEGLLKNTFSLINIISNFTFPDILFFCIEDVNYNSLKKTKVKVN